MRRGVRWQPKTSFVLEARGRGRKGFLWKIGPWGFACKSRLWKKSSVGGIWQDLTNTFNKMILAPAHDRTPKLQVITGQCFEPRLRLFPDTSQCLVFITLANVSIPGLCECAQWLRFYCYTPFQSFFHPFYNTVHLFMYKMYPPSVCLINSLVKWLDNRMCGINQD